MTSWFLVFAACVVLVSGDRHLEDDQGEYGKDSLWRRVMCENQDDNMFQDMDTCFLLERQIIQDAATGCIKRVLPESSGTVAEFVKAACADKPLFIKLDECFEEYEADEEYQKQEEITPEVKACYQEVLKKWDLKELLTYLE